MTYESHHCCHDRNEPCLTGWSDTHLHRCQPTADDQTEEAS